VIGLRKLSIRATGFILALATAASAAPADPAAPPESADCPMRLDRAADAPRFADYPALGARATRFVAPMLASREARMYRNALGAEAANGPNFAGNYILAAWGCGTSCTAFAIIDARNGRIFFPAGIRPLRTTYVGDWLTQGPLRYRGLRFNRDSRLLVLCGAPGGDEARDGATYLEWTGAGLRALHFIPRAELCRR
jgi:hypothetical protein